MREIAEESGFETRALKLAAVYDYQRNNRPHHLDSIYKLFFICEITGGAARVSHETSEVGFYHLEQHAMFAAAAGQIIEWLESSKFRGICSELMLLELIVKPLQMGRQDAADDYETLLNYFPNLQLEPVTRSILLDAAGLRARHRLRTPDAIQLATALQAGVTLAITNDVAWRNASVMETIVLADLRP